MVCFCFSPLLPSACSLRWPSISPSSAAADLLAMGGAFLNSRIVGGPALPRLREGGENKNKKTEGPRGPALLTQCHDQGSHRQPPPNTLGAPPHRYIFCWGMGGEQVGHALGQACHSAPFSNAVIFCADVNLCPNQISRQSSECTLFGNTLATP